MSETATPLRRLASRVAQSARVTATARTLTRTSSSLGVGRSTSSSRKTSGGPYLLYTTALMSRLTNIANPGRVSAARYEHAVEEVSRIRATCRAPSRRLRLLLDMSVRVTSLYIESCGSAHASRVVVFVPQMRAAVAARVGGNDR